MNDATYSKEAPPPSILLAGWIAGAILGALGASFVSSEHLAVCKHVTHVVHKQDRLTLQTFQKLIMLNVHFSRICTLLFFCCT